MNGEGELTELRGKCNRKVENVIESMGKEVGRWTGNV